MTIRNQILPVILALLNTDRPAGVPETVKGYTWEIHKEQLPFQSAYWGPENCRPIGGKYNGLLTERSLELKLDTFVAAAAGQTVDDALDPILSWNVKALAGQFSDGLFRIILESKTDPDLETVDQQYGHVVTTFIVEYQTRANDPEAWA